MSLLSVEGVSAGYGEVQVLRDVSVSLQAGQTTCVVGANGAGKTTLLRAIMGETPVRAGTVTFDGRDITLLSTHRITERGLVLVPEGRQLFTNLTVQENLDLGAMPPRARAEYSRNLERVFELFPRLKERKRQLAGTLSGGEQHMLAIGRGLMSAPIVLMLDEPSLGLAPMVVMTLYKVIRQLSRSGTTILLVEQSLHLALAISQHGYLMREGRVVRSGPATELRNLPEIRQGYLAPRPF